MKEIEELKKSISDSSLGVKQKQALLIYLENKGADIDFYDLFKKYLSENIEPRNALLEKTLAEMDLLQKELENKITEQKKEIENNLEEELGETSPTDFTTRERIWKEYYDELDRLGEFYAELATETINGILKKLNP